MKTNRIETLFAAQKQAILSVYFTAGFPNLDDTLPIVQALQAAGTDLIEIGMPYSDPVADGETIQQSNDIALHNGMTISKLFEQIADIRQTVTIPVLLMGYLNPVMQFGVEAFCKRCQEIGIDGLILPDLPLQVYQDEYKAIFEKHGLCNIFLITPQTPDERILALDAASNGFVYMVSSASVTGAKSGIDEAQIAYFQRIATMPLQNPRLIGFGISDNKTFATASQHAQGAIVGSAFIKHLKANGANAEKIRAFVQGVKG